MESEISKAYEPESVERRLYQWWEDSGFFEPELSDEKPSFSIVIPPPNVTGSLHMGHALNITLQDVLVRWKRMQGNNTLWVVGTDHAGIATQNVVERQLAEEGRHRTDLGRAKFEEMVWCWKGKYEDRILGQIRRLGCSCDWSRTRFTMDEGLSQAVCEVFVSLYEAGLVYRGEYLVNWCPRCDTAISDLEVVHEIVQGHLWHVRYPISGSDEFIVVATTRPETMLGDTAVAVHPTDERYEHLKGRSIQLPLMDREIPLIHDDFVDSDFGTGAVKVTPGHDPNDFEAGQRHQLAVVKVIGEDARMTSQAGRYQGLDRYEARKKIVQDLESEGLLEKVEEYEHSIGQCQRCETVVEPLVSTQWFVRVKELARPAIDAVEQGRTQFIPDNYARVYFEWMYNIRDWCISRQLWWGHRIPAWFCAECDEIIVSRTQPDICTSCQSSQLEQETDVLDTWFSSALWPFSTLGWPEKTPELRIFYPTNVLVTGFDIIFFWVARMLMMGLRFMDEVPFHEVCITGLVRDEANQKMSKSKGNVVDPLDLIEEYGADAVRFTLAIMATPGGDMPFSKSRMSGYRAFCNKIWNAARFVLLNLERQEAVQDHEIEVLMKDDLLQLEDRWILARLQQVIASTQENLEKYRFHEVCEDLYHFFWRDFCDWYIELIKADMTAEPGSQRHQRAETVACWVLESALRLLHPFIPFITEELWQRVPHRGESIMLAPFPEARHQHLDPEALEQMELLQGLITAVRTARSESNVEPHRKIPLVLKPADGAQDLLKTQQEHIIRLARLDKVEIQESLPASGFLLQGVTLAGEFALRLEEVLDLGAERARLEKQVAQANNELADLERKLANQDFVARAPDQVVARTRERRGEALERLSALRRQLQQLEQH